MQTRKATRTTMVPGVGGHQGEVAHSNLSTLGRREGVGKMPPAQPSLSVSAESNVHQGWPLVGRQNGKLAAQETFHHVSGVTNLAGGHTGCNRTARDVH